MRGWWPWRWWLEESRALPLRWWRGRRGRRRLTVTKPFSKWPSFTAKFARLKAWRIFLKTAQKLLNQITAVTGLITIEYLLILSQTEITDVSWDEEPDDLILRNSYHSDNIWRAWRPCVFCSVSSIRPTWQTSTHSRPRNICRASHLKINCYVLSEIFIRSVSHE